MDSKQKMVVVNVAVGFGNTSCERICIVQRDSPESMEDTIKKIANAL
jgi:hypothetical protein